MKKHFALLSMTFLLGSALIGGIVGKRTGTDSLDAGEKDKLFRKYGTVLSAIEANAVPLKEKPELVFDSARLMLQGLDPHSSFFSPKEYSDLQEDNRGRYFGLGIRIRAFTRGSGRIVVLEPPFPGTPAFKVGMQAGDVIFKVDGQSIDDWDVDDVIDHLKGPQGTTVHITVARPGEDKPLELDVVRDEIPKLTINYAYRIRPDIGYVKLEHFSETTGQELRDSLDKIGFPNVEGLILDLRDDPGGYLTQAIRVSQEFLPKGAPIVSTRDRDGRDEQKYSAREGGNLSVPLIVLLNPSSASASEIVAGAIQDNDRGLILGERSFGKGLVQTVYRLSEGAGLALTTGKYYTPSGRCLQRPYNGSLYAYYNARLRRNQKPTENEVHFTLAGRKVYGGGGIQPDYEHKSRKLNRFELTILSKDVFFKFANQTLQGQKPKDGTNRDSLLAVGPEALRKFRECLESMKVSCTDQEFKDNEDFIRRGIRAELATRLSGILDGFKIRAEGDEIINKALDLMPEARKMLLKTKGILANMRPRTESDQQ